MESLNHKVVKVLYHMPCTDGVFAALVFYLLSLEYPTTQFVFLGHSTFATDEQSQELLDKCDGSDMIYLLDYAGTRDFLLKLFEKGIRVQIIDHHKTGKELFDELNAENIVPDHVRATFSMEFCGATLADHMILEGELLPPGRRDSQLRDDAAWKVLRTMLPYVEDHDLWRKLIDDTPAWTAGFRDLNLEINAEVNPNIFAELLKLDVTEVIASGRQWLVQLPALLEEVCSKTFPLRLIERNNTWCAGESLMVTTTPTVLAVESSDTRILSDLGHKLAVAHGKQGNLAVGAVCNRLSDGRVKISLRASGKDDTTRISKSYPKGGGHASASGFTISGEEYESIKQISRTPISVVLQPGVKLNADK